MQSASGHDVDVVLVRGAASAQCVVQSMMVRMCLCPCDGGSGPTMSMWMCEKR
jgi:hypothetical protein